MNRYDLISPRPRKDGKTHWQKVGAAFPKDGGRFSLVFDALPLPDADGRVTVLMSPPKERDDSRQGYSNASMGGESARSTDPLDDSSIPF